MTGRLMRFAAGTVCALLLAPTAGVADTLQPALLTLSEGGNGEIEIAWKVRAPEPTPIPEMGEGCVREGQTRTSQSPDGRVLRWRVQCLDGLDGKSVTASGFGPALSEVLVRIQFSDGNLQIGRLSVASPSLIVHSSPTLASVAVSYFEYGFEHILSGHDHLLFVLALVLLLSGFRELFLAVTAFTLAHSITLALATLDIVRPSQAPVEAVIALSIVFLAAEVRKQQSGAAPSLLSAKPWIAAFAFGLLHGFGFASALLDVGLPEQDLVAALLFFNLGVEAGQVAFVVVTLLVLRAIRAVRKSAMDTVLRSTAMAIGVVAAFWTVQRIAAL